MWNEFITWVIANHVGELASIAGLIVTIVGFLYTLRNVKKSRMAAQDAKAAAEGVRQDMGRFDAVAELASAVTSIDEIKRHHRNAAWRILPDRYSALRKTLVSIRKSCTDLTKENQMALQRVITHLSNMEDQMEHLNAGQGTTPQCPQP